MKKLLDIIRKASSTKRWSKAVELSRVSEITVETRSSTEISFRLSDTTSMCSSVVTIWPEDEDWCCDCNSSEDPCLHVMASMILYTQSKQLQKKPRSKKAPLGVIGYRFSRKQGVLVLDRVIIASRKSIPLTSSLISVMNGRVVGPRLAPTKQDMTIDLLLKESPLERAPTAKIVQLFQNLEACKDVKLDNKVIKVCSKYTGFVARIEDEAGGVKIFGQQDSSITEVFRNGIALCGKKLRPIHNVKLAPAELKLLAEGKYFGTKEFVHIVSELIPYLRKKMMVEIRTKKIQDPIILNPRVDFQVKRKGHELILNTSLVYGDPQIATVIDNKLHLKNKKIPARSLEEEQTLRTKFINYFGFNLETKHRYVGEETVRISEKIKKWEGYKKIDVLDFFTCRSGLKPNLNVKEKNGKPSVELTFTTKKTKGVDQSFTADPLIVLEAWKNGQSLVPLKEGGWSHIPQEWLSKYAKRLLFLLESQDKNGLLPKAMISDVMELCAEQSVGEIPKTIVDINRVLQDSTQLPVYKDISGLNATLRPYQKDGVRWLTFLRKHSLGALLADDMGLGKTLQSICLLEGKSLIIAPTSVLYNWEIEIKRFRPNLKINIYHGANRQLDLTSDVILTTYAVMRLNQEELSQHSWDVVVLDEAQIIKNPDSKIAKAVYCLSSSFKLALTGTPIENSVEDLWSIFHFLNRGMMHQRKEFQRNYMKPILLGDEKVSQQLSKKVKPFVMRRMKSEVAKDLPPRTTIVLHNELDEQERLTYQALELASRQDLLKKMELNVSVMQMLESILRLRQSACHMGMLPGQTTARSSKVELLMTHLESCLAGNHKVLVFSQWTKFLDLIQARLQKSGLNHLRIDGTTKDRQQIVTTFQTDEHYPILLLSLKAAGIGLNLTAADHVFIMDPWWNPAVEDQAADRTYRIGQKKPVMVCKIVTKQTIEEKIVALQAKKKELMGSVMGQGKHVYQLTRKEILGLLD